MCHFVARKKKIEDTYESYKIEPKDMPNFLNEIAYKYFKRNEEVKLKLAQCSIYIHGVNYAKNEKEK